MTGVQTCALPISLDRFIPLQPGWALVYGALYAFLILLPVMVIRDESLIRRTFQTYLAVWLIAYGFFLAYPTTAPRPMDVSGDGFLIWALRVLQDGGWAALPRDETTLVVERAGRADAGHINEMLLGCGLRVFALQREQATLEELFLRLTGAGEGPAGAGERLRRGDLPRVSAQPQLVAEISENGGSR